MKEVLNMIGLLDHNDIVGKTIFVPENPRDKRSRRIPAKKAVLFLYLPECPHCKTGKKWLERNDISPYGYHKLAIDVSRDRKLSARIPKLFNLPEEYTVPQIFIIENGKVKKRLDSFKEIRLKK